jgi:hypothetical protein
MRIAALFITAAGFCLAKQEDFQNHLWHNGCEPLEERTEKMFTKCQKQFESGRCQITYAFSLNNLKKKEGKMFCEAKVSHQEEDKKVIDFRAFVEKDAKVTAICHYTNKQAGVCTVALNERELKDVKVEFVPKESQAAI